MWIIWRRAQARFLPKKQALKAKSFEINSLIQLFRPRMQLFTSLSSGCRDNWQAPMKF